ncbi:MAG: GspH/FimT family pseudopilin [Gammaproteobacteria bacterium]|nr:GspH/FimT family pseudopilin [Gammaproteobacteria bacterium]
MDVNFKPLSGRCSCAVRITDNQTSSGYTIIELMVTLAISSILIGFTAPSIQSVLASTRQTSHLNSLVSSFHLARSEAAKYGYKVVICKSIDGETCNTSMQWDQGWLVFTDQDDNRSRTADEPRLQVRMPFSTGQTLTYRRGVGSNNYITYHPDGFTRTNGTFTFCDTRGSEHAKALILYKTGRTRISRTRANGEALSCANS